MQKQLISQLSPTLESKSVFDSERGLTSTTWSEYSENTKRTQYSTIPTSSITAEGVIVIITTTRKGKGVTRVASAAANAVAAISQPSDSKYGDCTKEQPSRLHKDYSSFCKENPHSCKDSFVNCCEKVKIRLANAKECHRRRKKLNDICLKAEEELSWRK